MSGPRVYLENLCSNLRPLVEQANIDLVLIHSNPEADHPLFDEIGEIVVSDQLFRRGIELRSADLDLIHYHGYKTLAPLELLFHPAKTVTTVHGAAERVIPECFPARRRQSIKYLWPLLTRIFDHVITVTEASRQQLIEYFGLSPESITSVPNGVDDFFFSTDSPPDIEAREPYILNVNSVPNQSKICRKNIETLFQAFGAYRREGGQYKLHTVGDSWESDRIQQLLDAHNIDNGFVTHGAVSQQRLRELYQSASLYVYPSRYEGFGLSTLEAMACGCPVVVPEQPNLEEVTGGSVLVYGSPADAASLTRALHELEQNDEKRASLRSQGLENATRYSWERCAKETLQVYQNVLDS
jgi:glycosyltransferase involved in cell wall biosynthesis